MTETEKGAAWRITHWIIYTGTPGTESFRIHGGGESEAKAWRDAAAHGMPAGSKVGQIRERA